MHRPWGRNQPEVWGKSNKASMTAKRNNEARKRSRDHITSRHTGLGSMAKTLELKCASKPQTWESFGYRGVAKLHLHIEIVPLAAVHRLQRGKSEARSPVRRPQRGAGSGS